LGGVVASIEKGYIQKEIQNSAYRYLKEIEKSDRIIVGVNKFKIEKEHKPDLLKIDLQIQQQQIEKLKKVKRARDNSAVAKQLAHLKKIAQSEQNILPAILDAVKVYTTLGEICNVLRDVFGEYKEAVVL